METRFLKPQKVKRTIEFSCAAKEPNNEVLGKEKSKARGFSIIKKKNYQETTSSWAASKQEACEQGT